MKHQSHLLLLAILLASTLTSCTATKRVMSQQNQEEAINQISINLQNNGYSLSGKSTDTKNEVVVTGVSYSSDNGYGTAMGNNYYYYDAFTYTDSLGNTVNFQLKYQRGFDRVPYVEDIQVVGCSTSKAADYERLCMGAQSPSEVIHAYNNDMRVKYIDWVSTDLAASGIFLAAALIATALLL